MLETLERREFYSVTPVTDAAPVADTSSDISMPLDDASKPHHPKPKAQGFSTIVVISIIGVLVG